MAQKDFTLRDYQLDLIRKVYLAWKQQRRVLAQLPTGGGKTVVFSKITQDFTDRNKKVLILAHREELILQAAQKVGTITGCEVGIIKSGYEPRYDAPIQVASVQSMVNRLDAIKKIDLIIIDESHHAPASTYQTVLNAFEDAYQLGVTATPIRLDGSGFEDVFDCLVSGITVSELIDRGYLSRFKLFADPQPMSVKGVKKTNGDYNLGQIAQANNVVELAGNLINSYKHYGNGKSCVVFAINVTHSKAIAYRYNQVGITATHLDGNTPYQERKEALAKFAAGEIKVLCNCALFDEGLDIPALELVQIARPTQSLARWLQMVGRALRTAPNKEYAVLLDHTDNWSIHGLPTRPRAWRLGGVETTAVSITKDEGGEVTEQEFEPAEIVEVETELSEIRISMSEEWELIFEDLVLELEASNHQKGWLYTQLLDFKPPLEIWQKCGQYLGYSEGWATDCFNEQQMELEFQ